MAPLVLAMLRPQPVLLAMPLPVCQAWHDDAQVLVVAPVALRLMAPLVLLSDSASVRYSATLPLLPPVRASKVIAPLPLLTLRLPLETAIAGVSGDCARMETAPPPELMVLLEIMARMPL